MWSIGQVMAVGAIVMSTLASLAFGGALVMAYLSTDQANLELLVGAVVSNFSTAVSFWLGSSAGSRKKDEDSAVSRAQQPGV